MIDRNKLHKSDSSLFEQSLNKFYEKYLNIKLEYNKLDKDTKLNHKRVMLQL